MSEVTQPTRRLHDFQYVPTSHNTEHRRIPKKRKGCFWFVALMALALIYFIAPIRTNILLLGTDDSPERGSIGRTDTIILATIVPLTPYVGMLSIPRDLWVTIPDIGEQRINTAYFFAEANERGKGPRAALQTIRDNFDVPVHYYVVIHMAGLVSAVDALGGVDIQLDKPIIGGFPVGVYHLNGTEALVFVRERSSIGDFSRMQRGQILIGAAFSKVLQPTNWRNLPQLAFSLTELIDTNIPLWQWPRLLFAILRVPLVGVDSQTITRDMVVLFQTSAGAQVLAPNWEAINPLLKDMFGR